MQINLIETIEELKNEAENWKVLADRSVNPFLDLSVFLTWIEYYLGDKKIFVLKVEDDGKTLAYAPFYKKGSSLGWLGEGRVNYLDVICDEADKERVWPELLSFLRRLNIKIIKLPNINSMSKSGELIEKLGFKKVKEKLCPYMKIDPSLDWVQFYNSVLKNKRRYEVRKGLEKLEGAGLFKVINKKSDEVNDNELTAIFDLYKKRWQGSYRDKLIEERYYDYQKSLVKTNKDLFLSQAFLNDKLVSFILGFKKNKRFTDYIVAHDPDHADCSLGNVHLSKFIEHLHAEKFELFDFSIGDEVYKRKWAKEETINRDYIKGNFITIFYLIQLNKIKEQMISLLKFKRRKPFDKLRAGSK